MAFDCFKIHAKCKAGCCSTVPLEKDLWEKNQHKIFEKPTQVCDLGKKIDPFTMQEKEFIIPITKTNYCPFLDQSDYKCNIYNDRPEICRRFGDETHPCLSCAYLDKNGKEKSRQQTRKELRDNKSLLKVLL